MAGTSVVVDLLIKARDLASAPIRGIVAGIKFLDSEISVVAGKIRNAFSGLFGGGLDGSIEFEAQLSKVAAKGGFTAAEMAKLKKAATDIGPALGATGTEAAQGMEALAAAGLNANQVMQALPPVLALASAEGLSMDAAAEKLSDSLSIVGLGFEQAGRMADVLAKGANISTTSASALAEALASAGGIAKTAGLDLEGTVAALSALANAGIKGGAAGTALAAILTQLINPASAASKELSAIGITSRDFGEVIAQLKLKGDASNAAILAFGETAGPGLRALIQTGADGVAALETQLRSADGAAKAAADGISGNLKGALSALQSAWANVKTALFDPVLEPLTKQANELASALNDKLASGALKPVQDAIRAFADTGIKAGRDFVAGFDFNAALQSLQAFATGAKDAFTGIRDAGTTAASVVQIAWNGLTSGFNTIGASLLAVASSAVSNIAIIEAAASKVGLGSLERAAELRQTANELAAKAGELTQSIAKDGEDIQGAFGRLAGSADGAADGIKRVADEQKRLADASPAAEIQEIAKSLDDYRGMAERANTAAAKARSDFESVKISAQDYGAALLSAADANAALAAATEKQVASATKSAEASKKSAVALEAAAKSAEDAAKGQNAYTSALEQAGSAQAAAIRAEIDLARAKGDTAGAAQKTIELAKAEASMAAKVAESKREEANELEKAVVAHRAYLESIGGGTKAQQQELEILKLKQSALRSEANSTAELAQIKADITAKIQMFVAAGYDEIEAKRLGLLASGQFTAALKIEEEQRKKTTEATKEQKDATEETAAAEKDAATATREHAAQLAAAGDVITDTLNGWIDRLGALSPAAVQAFETQQKFTESTVETADAGQKATDALDELGQTMTDLGGSGFVRNMNETAAAAQRVEATFWGQAEAAEQVTAQLENLAETGAGNFDALIREATAAKASFNLLDQARLDNLQQAIDAANAKLRQMQEEAQSAADRIAELNAEIAAEKGDTAAADKLKLELEQKQALAEVDDKLAEAQAANNAALIALYEEQKRKLEELYRLKEKNLEADIRARENEDRTNRRGGNSASATGSGASSAPQPSAPAATGSGGGITVTVNAGNARLLDSRFVEDLARQMAPVIGNIQRRSA